MAHVLVVPARKLCDPVALFVLVESNDRLAHLRTGFEPNGGSQAIQQFARGRVRFPSQAQVFFTRLDAFAKIERL
jgi:hypothetical protein